MQVFEIGSLKPIIEFVKAFWIYWEVSSHLIQTTRNALFECY